MDKLKNGRHAIKQYVIFLLLIIECAVFALLSPNFLAVSNLLNVCRQVSMIGISAVGMAIVLLTGGIDISVGPVVALTGVITCKLIVEGGLNVFVAAIIAVLVATGLGCFNGFVITRFAVPPMIATLAMMTTAKGVSYLLTGGIPIYDLPAGFNTLGQGYVLGIPIPVIVLLVVFVLGYWFVEKTKIGRYIYATGGNEEAARLSGINTRAIKISVYAISAFLTSIAGLIMASRINSGQPSVGQGFEMDVIPATVLGGISLAGGEGRILNVIAGVLIMGVLSNGMAIMGIQEYWQWVVKGIVLVIAVSYDNLSKGNAKPLLPKKAKTAE